MLTRLDFEQPDLATFRCLALAYEAGRVGGTAPAWLNAANEVAVAAFLAGDIRWIEIPDVLSAVLDRHDGAVPDSADAIVAADARARDHARAVLAERGLR
jgi:1-deoxy-D-xylulose-5-phosphate reductoisomerase